MNKMFKAFLEGRSINAYKYFGAHKIKTRSKEYYRFSCYSPNALEIQVVGSFNNWNGDNHSLKKIDKSGIWEIIVEDAKEWDLYKFRIKTESGSWILKSDPYAFYSELRPKTSSVIFNLDSYKWNDLKWLQKRTKNFDKPLNIYECHLGSWRRNINNGEWLTLDDWLKQLVPYVKDNGFTHIELMPLNEHPFDGSWGYQATGYFSVTSRYGTPNQLKKLIDTFHQAKIGVILDVVPAHFVKDEHGLAKFDGNDLYEYPMKQDAENQWGTLNFNLWNECVRSFLMSSFAFWIKEYHFDGLRFDAISYMIYWGGDKNRGENQGAINFLKRSNYLLAKNFKTAMLIAEDSSDYKGVTKPTFEGGLGFDYKWDLGWMNDTLKYMSVDFKKRAKVHHLLTFSMMYHYNERFLLPFSHDEVVHMKGALINKFFGTYEEKFSQMRALIAFMYAHPGKKLNFMGNEIASFDEWNENTSVPFYLLKFPKHSSFLKYFKDVSTIYKTSTQFYRTECSPESFSWIDADNSAQSVYSFYRTDGYDLTICIFNMREIYYENYRLGVPRKGKYAEILNSEKDIYSGCNLCNFLPVNTSDIPFHNFEQSIEIKIAPFSAIYLNHKSYKKRRFI